MLQHSIRSLFCTMTPDGALSLTSPSQHSFVVCVAVSRSYCSSGLTSMTAFIKVSFTTNPQKIDFRTNRPF